MSAIIIGSVTGGVLAPGAKLSYNTDGTITGEATYNYATSDTVAPLGNAHPDDSRAICVAYTVEYNETFQVASLQYRGVWSTSAVRVDVQAGLQANPIETHPNFVSTLGGTPSAPLNSAFFDPTTGAFEGWPAGAALNLGGVRFYLAAANTYRFTFSTTNAATVATAVGNIGQVASSVSAGGLTISQSNGFMLQNVLVEYEYVGVSTQIYTYTLVWVSTQPPGWNTNIYPP